MYLYIYIYINIYIYILESQGREFLCLSRLIDVEAWNDSSIQHGRPSHRAIDGSKKKKTLNLNGEVS